MGSRQVIESALNPSPRANGTSGPSHAAVDRGLPFMAPGTAPAKRPGASAGHAFWVPSGGLSGKVRMSLLKR